MLSTVTATSFTSTVALASETVPRTMTGEVVRVCPSKGARTVKVNSLAQPASGRASREIASKVMVVMLHSDLLSQQLKTRYQVTTQLLDSAGVSYRLIDGQGQSPLSHIMTLVLCGDYTSYYLALLNRVDPTPVKNIEYVKEHLRKEKTKW